MGGDFATTTSQIALESRHPCQAFGSRRPAKYRDIILNTAAEIAHAEMLATAVALNLEGALLSFQEKASPTRWSAPSSAA
jgi:Mn-containing catalase